MAGESRGGKHLSGESLDVLARTYHTENGNVHVEGEAYTVTDAALAQTLVGCGFVTAVGWTPDPPDPPLEGRQHRPGQGLPGDHPGRPGKPPDIARPT